MTNARAPGRPAAPAGDDIDPMQKRIVAPEAVPYEPTASPWPSLPPWPAPAAQTDPEATEALLRAIARLERMGLEQGRR